MMMNAFNKAHANFPEGGTCLEFGVWRGISFMLQVNAIISQYPQSSIIGFDSWQGLPEETNGVWRPDRHAAGNYSCEKDVVINSLAEHNLLEDKRVRLVDGFFEDSLTKELQDEITNLIFVNMDVDIHKSCVEVLEFVRPLLMPGTIIYFDDWKDPDDTYDGKWGEHLAWEEYIIKYPETRYKTLEVNELNQRYIEIE